MGGIQTEVRGGHKVSINVGCQTEVRGGLKVSINIFCKQLLAENCALVRKNSNNYWCLHEVSKYQ